LWKSPWADVANRAAGAGVDHDHSVVGLDRQAVALRWMRWTPRASVRLASVTRRIALSAVSTGGAVFVMMSVLQDGWPVDVASFIVTGHVHERE
jgi:hypothetical protein